MSQYATVKRVLDNIPSKRAISVDDDAEILIEIEQASAWVDSLYADVAPFPNIGDGTFTELYLANSASEGAESISIEESLSALTLLDGEGNEINREFMLATSYDFDSTNPGGFDGIADYTIYKITSEIGLGDASINFKPGLITNIPSEDVRRRRKILVGTPPLIRLATELMTRFNILTSGPNANTSKDINSLELRAAKLLNATVQVEKIGNVIEGPAYSEPHPQVNIFRHSIPKDVRIVK